MAARSGGPETMGKRTTMFCELNSSKKVDSNKTKFAGTCRFLPQRSELSPVKYIKHLGNKMMATIRFIAARKRSCTKVTSSGTPKQPMVAPIDSQRAEAIDDCIEFINSSSSLTRSNSVTC
ncbi:hypothetical protein Ccrd_003876 [Cynara cardunculus var. scolymus]|uniref:Josephin-like protein n=1 Tax=Cynara cardunculus var. scolymus TaxID=59895 RepID=A0A118JVH4_CYNCS|nr:hypothetical protein Ccrd_003876 [Cynara cardunculus var. scolymus]